MITIWDEVETLAKGSVLSGLPSNKLGQLAFASRRIAFPLGEVITRQGDTHECGFLLLAGKVIVSRTEGNETRDLATLGPGFLIGDHALTTGGGYKVTVTAKEPVETLQIHRETFLTVLDGETAVMGEILRTLEARRAQAEELFSMNFD